MKTGRRYANEIIEGCFGTCMLDKESSPFYIVQWSGKPWRAEKDGEEELDDHVYKWRKGDSLCQGNWLDKLHGKSWYTMDKARRQCIVKLEHVVNANLDLRSYTAKNGDNPLPRLPIPSASKARVDADEAWRFSDVDNIWLAKENMRRGDNFEYDAEEVNKVLYQEKWTNSGRRWGTMTVANHRLPDPDIQYIYLPQYNFNRQN